MIPAWWCGIIFCTKATSKSSPASTAESSSIIVWVSSSRTFISSWASSGAWAMASSGVSPYHSSNHRVNCSIWCCWLAMMFSACVRMSGLTPRSSSSSDISIAAW